MNYYPSPLAGEGGGEGGRPLGATGMRTLTRSPRRPTSPEKGEGSSLKPFLVHRVLQAEHLHFFADRFEFFRVVVAGNRAVDPGGDLFHILFFEPPGRDGR